jgi:hypothetical protein
MEANLSSPSYTATVVHSPSTQEEATFFTNEIQRSGIDTEIFQGNTERGSVEIVLIVLLAIPIRTFLEAFGKSLGESAADSFMFLIKKTIAIGGRESGSKFVVIREREHGAEYQFSDDLPLEAYTKLAELKVMKPGAFRYDRLHLEWIQIRRDEDEP